MTHRTSNLVISGFRRAYAIQMCKIPLAATCKGTSKVKNYCGQPPVTGKHPYCPPAVLAKQNYCPPPVTTKQPRYPPPITAKQICGSPTPTPMFQQTSIAINGFGRIGKCLLRLAVQKNLNVSKK